MAASQDTAAAAFEMVVGGTGMGWSCRREELIRRRRVS